MLAAQRADLGERLSMVVEVSPWLIATILGRSRLIAASIVPGSNTAPHSVSIAMHLGAEPLVRSPS